MSILRKSTVSFVLLVPLLILHLDVFGESPHNPVGILYLNELYLAICMAFTFFYLLTSIGTQQREFKILMTYAVYSSVVFIGLPAIFSFLFYGQPLVYGLIEERRILFSFGFATLMFLGRNMSASQFEKALLITALLAAVMAWMFKFGVLPDLRDKQSSFDRPDRSSIGAPALCLAYFYCIQTWNKGISPIDGSARSKTIHIVLAMVFLLTLVFGTQTRQLIVLALVFTVFCLKSKSIVWICVSTLLLSPFFIFPDLMKVLGLNLDFYAQSVEDGPTDGVREQTIGYIFSHLSQNHWLPSGSLSLMWNNGFIPYFGEYFFLSDVGVFGTLFRFGFLAFIIVPVSLFLYYRWAKMLHPDTGFVVTATLAQLVIWPLAGFFEYLQATICYLMVIQALRALHHYSSAPVQETYVSSPYPRPSSQLARPV